jgi:hypothetical protein
MNLKPVPNKLAATSLTLGILGWMIYLLQWCFDLTIGLLLAAFTAGASAICSTVLDFLPFALWLTGIVAGHVALGQIRHTGAPGRGRAVWGLVLSYIGMAFTILFIVIIFILITAGVGVGVLGKILPALPGH